MQDLISKAATLLEALPYLQKYSGATFVVKYGGSFMDSPDPVIRTSVARDIVFLEAAEINPVVVHGGGKAITRAMEKAGLKAQFVQGQRVTDEATVRVVDAVLSGEINPEVVTTISSLGGLARGFAGTEVFTCRKLLVHGPDGQPLDIGFVGEVTGVNTAPLLACIEKGITPVISPTARDKDGQVYNCNADVAAARAAAGFHERCAGLAARPQGPRHGDSASARQRGGRSQARRDCRAGHDSQSRQRGRRHSGRGRQGLVRRRTRASRGASRDIHRRRRWDGGGALAPYCANPGWPAGRRLDRTDSLL